MTRPIICAVDDSDHAMTAVRVADDLARQMGAPLELVHVAPPVPSVLYGVPFDEPAFRRAAEEVSTELLDRATALCAGPVEASHILWEPRPAPALAQHAREADAQLLVLGRHGRGAISSLLLGSVTRQLLSDAPCPLVVVPPDADDEARDGD